MAEAMRLGIFLPTLGAKPEPDTLSALAQEAEGLGFDSLWVPDHVLRVFGPVLDPLTTLAFLAGSTRRIQLGTSVLVLPYRHPVPLANVVSSLDVLSGGRLVLGVGAGWNEGEFAATGTSPCERGARTDEALEVLTRLWSGGPASYAGRFYSVEDADLGTDPLTEGGPPILVGGKSDAALRRALRFANGWNGFGDTPEQILDVRERLARMSENLGRDSETLEISTVHRVERPGNGTAETIVDELGRLAGAGVELCVLSISPADPESLAWVAEEVAPRFGVT